MRLARGLKGIQLLKGGAASKPAALDALYGRSPVSWKLFFRLRPGRMKHDAPATRPPATTPAPPHKH